MQYNTPPATALEKKITASIICHTSNEDAPDGLSSSLLTVVAEGEDCTPFALPTRGEGLIDGDAVDGTVEVEGDGF